MPKPIAMETTESMDQDAPATPEIEAAPAPVPLAPTSAAEWKRKARAVWRLKLPSGFVIDVKRIDLTKLLTDGVLTSEDWAPMNDIESTEPIVKRAYPAARKAAPYIAVSPRVGIAEPGSDVPDDTLNVDVDISNWDIVQMFLWAGGWSEIEATEVV